MIRTGAVSVLAIAALLFALVGCRTPSASESRLTVAEPVDQGAAPFELVPTTAPIVEEPTPAPTPIDLRGGRGIVVSEVLGDAGDGAEADSGAADAADDSYSSVAAPTGDSYSSVAAPQVTPTATSEPEPESTPTPTPDATPVPDLDPEPTPTPAPTEPDLPDEALAANGGEVYALSCAKCHADNGFGTFQGTSLLGSSARYSQVTLVEELTNGHPYTFGFADELSAAEIAAVSAYVLSTFG